MALLFNPFIVFLFIAAAMLFRGIRLIWKREITRKILEDGQLVTVTYRGRIPLAMGLRLILSIVCIAIGIIATFTTNNQIWNSLGFFAAVAIALFIEYLIRDWRRSDVQG